MSALSDFEVRELDKSLAIDGEWIELWRTAGILKIPFKVRCRAKVKTFTATQLIGGLKQDTSEVIISPTQIIQAGWPGPWVPSVSQPTPTKQDRRVPKNGDPCVIMGKQRTVDIALPTYVDGDLVRMLLRVTG